MVFSLKQSLVFLMCVWFVFYWCFILKHTCSCISKKTQPNMNSFIKEREWDQDINGAIYKSDYFRQIIIGVINHYIYESFFGIKNMEREQNNYNSDINDK